MAGVEWAWMHRLQNDGIACAQPVALGEEVRRGREMRSAVVTLAAPGMSLERWCERWTRADRAEFRSLLLPLANLIARLHGCGYIHRDLYLSHAFYDPCAARESCLRLIDLQRVLRPNLGIRRWMVKDLAALNYSTPMRLVSTTDRVRWLKAYLGITKLEAGARQLLYRVLGKTQSIVRHDHQRRIRLHENQRDRGQ